MISIFDASCTVAKTASLCMPLKNIWNAMPPSCLLCEDAQRQSLPAARLDATSETGLWESAHDENGWQQ